MPQLVVGSNSFLDVVRELPELRPFPVTAARLIAATADPDVGAGDLAAIFRHDPALSVRVLQIANSSLYGYSGKITTVRRAVVVLGVSGRAQSGTDGGRVVLLLAGHW